VPNAGPGIKGRTGFAVTDGAVRVMLPARAWNHEFVGPALDRVVALVHAARRGGSGLIAGPREAPYLPVPAAEK
jgi:hypothetical protein